MTYEAFMAQMDRRTEETNATLRAMGLPESLSCRKCGEPIILKGGTWLTPGFYVDCQQPECEDQGPARPNREEAVIAYVAGEKPEPLGDVIISHSPCES